MKAISFLLLALVIACNPTDIRRRNQVNDQIPIANGPAQPQIPPQTQSPAPTPVPVPQPQESTNGHELVVEIDQVNSILTITGNAARICGINFLVPHKMHYEVHSASQATITLDGNTLELNRIDDSDETKIFGDWSMEHPDGGNIIFHIRLDPVLKVEANCELS